MDGKVQSVYFMKPYYTNEKALKWLNSYGYKPIKPVHELGDELRYRIREPTFKRYITRIISNGVHLVIGYH